MRFSPRLSDVPTSALCHDIWKRLTYLVMTGKDLKGFTISDCGSLNLPNDVKFYIMNSWYD